MDNVISFNEISYYNNEIKYYNGEIKIRKLNSKYLSPQVSLWSKGSKLVGGVTTRTRPLSMF